MRDIKTLVTNFMLKTEGERQTSLSPSICTNIHTHLYTKHTGKAGDESDAFRGRKSGKSSDIQI